MQDGLGITMPPEPITMRTFVTFESDFPDDGEFTEQGDTKRPAGCNVAFALAELLRRQNLSVTDPIQYSFYGWAFQASGDGVTLRFLLQFPGPWLLLSQDRSNFFHRMFRASGAAHQDILKTMNVSLIADGRFRNLKWFSKKEYESGNKGCGSPHP